MQNKDAILTIIRYQISNTVCRIYWHDPFSFNFHRPDQPGSNPELLPVIYIFNYYT
jgi:hypothetical protein